jgi:hypothetical protein
MSQLMSCGIGVLPVVCVVQESKTVLGCNPQVLIEIPCHPRVGESDRMCFEA